MTDHSSLPYVGKTVHYRIDGNPCFAAIVTGLLGYSGNVHLHVLYHSGYQNRLAVPYDEDEADATWHYPSALCTQEAAEWGPMQKPVESRTHGDRQPEEI